MLPHGNSVFQLLKIFFATELFKPKIASGPLSYISTQDKQQDPLKLTNDKATLRNNATVISAHGDKAVDSTSHLSR